VNCEVTGKVRHVDELAARAVQARMSYGDRVKPYPCPHCDGWHLGGHHRPSRHGRGGDELSRWAGEPRHNPPEGNPIGGTTIGERCGLEVR
jgi:hypothetical protein